MCSYFPQLLTQKNLNNKKQLPLASLSLHLASVLLHYFYPRVFYKFKDNEVPLSMIFTSELLTVFAKNLGIELVYDVWLYFVGKCKKGKQKLDCWSMVVLLVMGMALVGLEQKSIMQQQQQSIFGFMSTKLKPFTQKQQLSPWFNLASTLLDQIQPEFQHYLNKILTLNSFSQQHIQKVKSQQTYYLMVQKDKDHLSWLIQVQEADIINCDQNKCVFLVLGSNDKVKSLVKRKENLVLLDKAVKGYQQSQGDEISFDKVFKNIEQLVQMNSITNLIVILPEEPDSNYLKSIQFIIRHLSMQHSSIKSMKIHEQNISLSAKSRQSKQSMKRQKKSHCSLI